MDSYTFSKQQSFLLLYIKRICLDSVLLTHNSLSGDQDFAPVFKTHRLFLWNFALNKA